MSNLEVTIRAPEWPSSTVDAELVFTRKYSANMEQSNVERMTIPDLYQAMEVIAHYLAQRGIAECK